MAKKQPRQESKTETAEPLAGTSASHAKAKSRLAPAATGKARRPAGDGQRETQVDGDGEPDERPEPAFTIVGVGASAGGLEAFTQLLRALPADANMAVIYVQHLSPRHESALVPLLREATSMPVEEITEGMEIKPGEVYVMPPNTFLSVSEGVLRLAPRPEDRSRHMPVDSFLRSLAEYGQQRAVGVVLSGTDSDGAAGLREIKAVGGITFAQDPATAKFDGMPRSAVSTGAVDMVLPPEEISRELVRLASHPLLRHVKARAPSDVELAISQEQWNRVFALLRNASGVDFTHYKQPTLRRRLQRRLVLHKFTDLEAYLRFLQHNPTEVMELYKDVLIHVTRFFREPDSYELLTSKVFPQLVRERNNADRPLRIWVPGCSTGEEAYSVAIALLEFLGHNNAMPVQIFATDVSESAVDVARGGVYPESISADVSSERLRRFFTKVDGSFRINKPIRDMVIFARQDLTRDPPFSNLDLIVCRNVLIYLGPVLQKKLMNVFHYALRPTGFLVLGGSETIGTHADLFALADKRHKLYTKKMNGIRSTMDFPAGDYAPERADAGRKHPVDLRSGPNILNEANRIILNRYAPPGVIVDEELQIIQFRGQTGPFLEPAPGEASLNLLKMVREGLLFDVRTALHDARKSGTPVRREGLRVKYNGQLLDVNIEVTPLVAPQNHRHFMVVFEDVTPRLEDAMTATSPKRVRLTGKKSPKKSAGKSRDESNERIIRLQQELAAIREYLQSIIQDLEAANEELQSANEEILSSNEELQSTNEELDTAKEELQSTNEELNTVNEELQARNEELSRANSDLLNLLSSVQIAVVMVTADLRIRRFTPMAEKLLNLIPTDVGRPIGDIKPNIDLPELEKLIVESVDTVNVIERETRDRQGARYLVRIRPYKSVENRIDGAVLALFDLEMGKRPER